MQNFYKLFCLLIFCFFCAVSQNLLAQPVNDECVNAIDISDAFMGNCGDFTFNGPFDLTGSTSGADDPPEPGEMENATTAGPFCPDETDANLFGDDSEVWENSVWYTWTVPDLNGDGSPVAYSIWTSDGSFGDNCGLTNVIGGDADTQVAIYEGPDCPNASTDPCDHFAANEDLFTVPPWISGWLTLEFTPGTTYYMGVDGWDGVQGEFCLTVVLCGVECGDGECAPVETYCDCDDCKVDAEGNSTCTFGNIAPIQFVEDDPATPNDETAFLFSDDLQGNIFYCSERVNGFAGPNTYMGFGAFGWTDCSGADGAAIDLTLSAGQFTAGATVNDDGTVTIPPGNLLYIELTPEEIDAGSITISSSVPDGAGNACDETITINFADFPQATDPFCTLTCFAGGIDTNVLDNGLTICEETNFEINTDGFERLDLPCNSDNGSSYQYAWRVRADLYGYGDYQVVTNWQPLGSNPTINPTDFFIDEFGYVGPYYTPGYPIVPGSVPLQIEGAALCLNADATVVDGCLASNEGYDNSFISITYLPAGDAGCPEDPGECTDPNGVDCAGVCGGSAVVDCAGECGGSATTGSACDEGGEAGMYDADCNCEIPTTGTANNDDCPTAPDISAAITEECERIGPFDQTGATLADEEPPSPECFEDGYNGTTWYTFTVPDGIGDGQPTGYSISTGAFEDCGTSNPLGGGAEVDGGTVDTQIAVYDGESGCPNTSAVPLACSDDTPSLPINYKLSSLELNLIPGNKYYIMVETFGVLEGEFCFYIAPTAKPTCVDCTDNSCTEVFGEDFTTCPENCPCVVDGIAYTVDPGIGFPSIIMDYETICPENVGASGDGLYIAFSLNTDNVPVSIEDNITFPGSSLTTSVGTLYEFVFGGAPRLSGTEGTKNVTLVYLTPDEIAAGVMPVISFVDATGLCTVSITLDAPLDVDPNCPDPNCDTDSSSLALPDGSEATSICVADDTDEPIQVIVNEAGSGEDSAWIITDLAGDVLALPDGPPFILDGAGEGECLIWMVNWCGDLSETLAVGVNVPSVVATSSAAISNSITVLREGGDCGTVTCTDDNACNTGEEGECDFGNTDCADPCNPVSGCTDAMACNYNADACVDDGSCDSGNTDCADPCNPVSGCTDAMACNYNPDACVDDGSCDSGNTDCADPCNPISGCTDAMACNYDADACEDDDSCDLGNTDCADPCNPVSGCTDAMACNYNPDACEDDGSCDLGNTDCADPCNEVSGCTDAMACNYNADACVDDGSCGDAVGTECTDAEGNSGTIGVGCDCSPVPVGCMDPTACNYNEDAEIEGPCFVEDCAGECGGSAVEDCAGECNGSAVEDCAGECNGSAVEDCAGECNGSAVEDCTGVCNGSAVEDCAGVCNGDSVEDCNNVCGGDAIPGAPCGENGTLDMDCDCQYEVVGCMDDTACNYNPEATAEGPCDEEDCAGECGGSAVEDCAGECGGSATTGSACTDSDGDPSTYGDDCVCIEIDISTCMDETACNNGEVGDCTYPDPGFNCNDEPICMDETACNNDEVGDCTYPEPGFDCDGEPINETCDSEGGTLGISEGGDYSSTGFICDGSSVAVDADDFVLLAGQSIIYVYHQDGPVNSADALQNVLQLGSSFSNSGQGKEVIYVTAYGAKTLDNGEPDFTDPCITYSNTLTITLLSRVNIAIDEECEAEKGEFTFAITITGGLAECVPSTSFEVTGDYWNGILTHGQSQPVGPIQDAENYSVTASDENGCTNTVSRSVNCTKLPIELISFDGEALKEGNLLKWVTATEIENDFYTIESSTNGIDYKEMNSVKGQGNTSSISSYNYLDRTASKGITYYRLSQTDFDGTTAKVGVVAIERGETSFNITELYPIPTSDFINLDFMAPEQSIVDIEIYDLIGKTMETFRATSVGSNLLKIEVSDYSVGVYFISIKSNDSKVTQKFVVE